MKKINKESMKGFVKRLDETFPDIESTTEVMERTMGIGKDVVNTMMCATATAICLGQTATDVTLLTVGGAKTIVKKSFKTVVKTYESTPVVCVAR